MRTRSISEPQLHLKAVFLVEKNDNETIKYPPSSSASHLEAIVMVTQPRGRPNSMM